MKKLVCRKCNWWFYNPPKPKDMPKCLNCDYVFNYKADIEEDRLKSLPVDWTQYEDVK